MDHTTIDTTLLDAFDEIISAEHAIQDGPNSRNAIQRKEQARSVLASYAQDRQPETRDEMLAHYNELLGSVKTSRADLTDRDLAVLEANLEIAWDGIGDWTV